MRKFMNVILVVTLTTLLAGCGVRFGIENRNNNDIEDSNYTSEEVNILEPMNEITKLDIRIDISNVKINYYDGNDIEISGKLSRYSKGVRTKRDSNTIIIIEESRNNKRIIEENSSELLINIPREFSGDFEFEFGVGQGEINDLELNDFKISNGVGELNLNEVSFNKLDLESGVGETTLTTNKKTGEINIEGGVGETNISLGDINGNLNFDGGMGSTTIKVPVDAPININTASGIGEVKINAKTSDNPKYTFDISVGIGEVEITN